MILARHPRAGARGREGEGHHSANDASCEHPEEPRTRGLPGREQEAEGWGAASEPRRPRGTKQPLFHLCPALGLLSTMPACAQQLPAPECIRRAAGEENARGPGQRRAGGRMHVSAGRTWQGQAVLRHLPLAAGLGPLLGVSSACSTAPVYPVAGLWLLPRPQGLSLSRVGRRRKEAIKCEACPESGYTDATTAPAYFGNSVEAGKLLGHLPPARSPPYPRKIFRDRTSEEPGL